MARRTGLCILRVWQRDGGLVIQLRLRTDVESPATERESATADLATALRSVEEFLLEMAAAAAAGNHDPPPR